MARGQKDLYKRNAKGLMRKYFTVNGKQYSVYGKTNEELFDKEAKKREEIASGVINLHNPTLKSYYDTFTKIRRNQVRESTLRGQLSQFKTIANVCIDNDLKFGDMRINDIKRRDIELVRQKLLDEGKTPENLNICFAHLNHVFHSAVIDETIKKNPCKELKRLKRSSDPATHNIHRALSVEETKAFFKAAAERNSLYINVFELMIRTGLRIGELAALYITDIDKKNGFIHIRRTITRDEIGNYLVGEEAKTSSGLRDIPLTPDMITYIKRQDELNRKLFGFGWSGLLFKSSEGDILREYTLNREIKRICKVAGINVFTSHAFRDTFATRFIEQRPQDYKVLSEILGHKDISITLNLYTHVMTDQKVNSMMGIQIMTS